MPSTVNGIGTHYYGKKNREYRPGPCPHCGAAVQLESYDTRLWFVVVFIPIIPLGRKRIIDKCPSCTRHFSVEADKWETSKQLEVSGAKEKFRANPTPETAIALHQRYVNFHMFGEAAAYRQEAGSLFPDSAMLQAYFGDSLAHFGKFDEAAPFYARAFALRSDLPEARTGLADGHRRAGRLDAARPLLDFLEKPGAAQLYSLAPLELLGLAYQKANRHDDALALFAKLLAGLPHLADHKGFRSMVQKSEKALGRPKSQSLLPKRKFSWRNLLSNPDAKARSRARSFLILGVVLALAALGFVIANEYIRRNRTVYVVNGYNTPATVELTGTGVQQKVSRLEPLVLAEGTYHAVISGPVKQELDFTVEADYFSRWFDDPAWILNVGGDAILMRRVVVYRRDPPPASFDFLFGRSFESLSNVTHPFQPLPATMQVNENDSRTLVDVQFYDGNAEGLFGYFMEQKDPEHALQLAESWLRTHPADEAMLRGYTTVAQRRKAAARVDAYLRDGLAVRPVRIEWHRAYQNLHDSAGEHDALVAKYDALLATAPADSGLLYLRGRVDSSRAGTRDFFERAARANARNPYPLFGLAYDHMAAGDWAAARPLLAQVLALQPKDQSHEYSLTIARLASGEAAAVEQETRAILKRDPANIFLTDRLIDTLAIQGHPASDILQVCDAFDQASKKLGEDGKEAAAGVRRHAWYALGDFAALEKAARGGTPADAVTRAQALIELGRLAEAGKALPAQGDDEELFGEKLMLAAAWHAAGNAPEADRWLALARKVLTTGNQDYARINAWLGDATPPTVASAQEVALPPRLKAMVLTAVIAWHPEARAELAPLIRRLNAERIFPFQFMQRATLPAT